LGNALERFYVTKSPADKNYYLVVDLERNEAAHVHISRLRDPHFNLGAWYAHVCASRSGYVTHRNEVARRQFGHLGNETALGRGLERKLEFALERGSQYWNDDEYDGENSPPRFLVQRDPEDSSSLLVFDKRRGKCTTLAGNEAETPGFDCRAWYE